MMDILLKLILFGAAMGIGVLLSWWLCRRDSEHGMTMEPRGSHETNPFRPSSPSVKTSRPPQRTPPPPTGDGGRLAGKGGL